MIISCDPPRHALLIHFGKRKRPGPIDIVKTDYHKALIEIALDRNSDRPTLISIHFVRHGFRLPFVSIRDPFSSRSINFNSALVDDRYFFHFSYHSNNCSKFEPVPGLTILLSGAPSLEPSGRQVTDRPVLYGIEVKTGILNLPVMDTEFVFEFGADNLKDGTATLFFES